MQRAKGLKTGVTDERTMIICHPELDRDCELHAAHRSRKPSRHRLVCWFAKEEPREPIKSLSRVTSAADK